MVSKWLRQKERNTLGGGRRRGMENQGSEVFVSLPSGWKPEAKIEETSPLSTDLTVILCYHSAKIKVQCIHRFMSMAPEATGKSVVLRLMAAGFWAVFLLSRSQYKLRELHFLQESLSLLAFS